MRYFHLRFLSDRVMRVFTLKLFGSSENVKITFLKLPKKMILNFVIIHELPYYSWTEEFFILGVDWCYYHSINRGGFTWVIASNFAAIGYLHYRVFTEMALEILGYTMCRVRLWWLVILPHKVSKLVYAGLEVGCPRQRFLAINSVGLPRPPWFFAGGFIWSLSTIYQKTRVKRS